MTILPAQTTNNKQQTNKNSLDTGQVKRELVLQVTFSFHFLICVDINTL